MKWIAQGVLAVILIFIARDELCAQAFVEYGKGLGGVKAPSGGISKGGSRGMRRGGATGQQGSVPAPVVVIPAALSVKDDEAYLYAQQDEYSARVEKAEKGALLTPVGQATANGEKWFMVRSQQGTVGWVKATAVDEIPKAEEKNNPEQAQKDP